jgi:hypothetical protein
VFQFDRETTDRLRPISARCPRGWRAAEGFLQTSLDLHRKTGFDIVTEADLAAEAHCAQLHIAEPEGMLKSGA